MSRWQDFFQDRLKRRVAPTDSTSALGNPTFGSAGGPYDPESTGATAAVSGNGSHKEMMDQYRALVKDGETHPSAFDLERYFLNDPALHRRVRGEIRSHIAECKRCRAKRERYEQHKSWLANGSPPCD